MFFQKFAIAFLLTLSTLPICISANDLKCLDVRANAKPILSGNKDTTRCVMALGVASKCKDFSVLYMPITENGLKKSCDCKQPEGASKKPEKATEATELYKCLDDKGELTCIFTSKATMDGSFEEFKNMIPHCNKECSDAIIDSAKFTVFGYNATMDPAVVKELVQSSSQFHGNLFIFVYSLVLLYVSLQ